MHRLTRRAVLTASLAASVVACATNKYASQGSQQQPPTMLVVRNDNFLDHGVYLLFGSQRIRLGVATGNATSKFVIPSQYVFGVSSLQFLLDPIGSRAMPVTDKVNVSPGDEIDLTIPATPTSPITTSIYSPVRPPGP